MASRSAGILPAAFIQEKINRQGAKGAKEREGNGARAFLPVSFFMDFLTAKDAKEEKFRESWVKKNRIHSLLGALGVLAVQI